MLEFCDKLIEENLLLPHEKQLLHERCVFLCWPVFTCCSVYELDVHVCCLRISGVFPATVCVIQYSDASNTVIILNWLLQLVWRYERAIRDENPNFVFMAQYLSQLLHNAVKFDEL